MTIVFKVSDNLKNKIIDYYKDLRKEKTPPYAIFQAQEEDTTITMYQSGKIMFQGTSADIDAGIWIDLEKKLNKRIINLDGTETKEKPKEKAEFMELATIGSDEVGTGDFFGPIVVTATFVSTKDFDFLKELGVRDSKKLTDQKIKEIAPKIMAKIPYVTTILDNETYNKHYNKNMNMNKLKAILHNKALLTMKNRNYNYAKIVVDEFCSPDNYYNYLKEIPDKVMHITFMTKAEDQVLSVACASIISRYKFLQKMDELSDLVHIPLPKGAGTNVDKIAKEVIENLGFETLNKIAKMNFSNANRL